MSDLHIRGLDQVINVLSNLPRNMQKQAIRRGLTRAAAQVRDEARLRAPSQTGKLRRAIRSGSPRQNQDGTFSVRILVDSSKEHGFLGWFHEYGVSPHYITAGESGVSARLLTRRNRDDKGSMVINGSHVSGAILHPGHAARPFLRPALDIKADDAVKALAFEIEEFVFNLTGFQAAA